MQWSAGEFEKGRIYWLQEEGRRRKGVLQGEERSIAGRGQVKGRSIAGGRLCRSSAEGVQGRLKGVQDEFYFQ